MSIPLVTTRGYGNGSLTGDISGIVARGFIATSAVAATSITVSGITGGADLTSLSYVVFDTADIGTGSIIAQANDETTDSNGDLVIDLTSLGVSAGTVLTIIITDYTIGPSTSNRAAVCYGTAVA